MAVLRNVSKTDTLETQRQKVNALASDVFEITGGSGNLTFTSLKLADGTKEAPALSFASETRTGLYKADNKLTFVNLAKKVFDIDDDNINSLRDLNFYTSSISTSAVTTRGSGYYTGTYEGVNLLGGAGDSAVATIVVVDYFVNITNPGSGYPQDGSVSVVLTNAFTNTYVVTLFETKPADFTALTPPEYEYRIGGTNTGFALTRGNTYKFDISDASLALQPFHFELDGGLYINPTYAQVNIFGNFGEAGSFAQVIIKPAFPNSSVLSIVRNTSAAVATSINLTTQSGTLGSYGSGSSVTALITGGVVQDLSFSDYGDDFKVGDVLGIANSAIVSAATPITNPFSGTITALGGIKTVSITSGGNGYEPNDTLTISNEELPLRSYWQLSLVDHYQLVLPSGQTDYYWRVGDTVSYNLNTPTIAKLIYSPAVNTGVATVSIASQGTSYTNGTYTVTANSTSGSGSQFVLRLTVTSGTVSLSNITILNPGVGYAINDTLTFIGFNVGSNNGPIKNVVDTSASDPARTNSINNNVAGTGGTGTGARFNVLISTGGITNVSIANPGTGYTTGDVITIPASSIGGTGSAVTLQVTAFTDLVLNVATTQNVTPVHSLVVTNASNLLFTPAEIVTSAVTGTYIATVAPIVSAVNSSKQYYLNDGIYPTYTLSVTNSGASNYVFNGSDNTTAHYDANNPTINVSKGDKLVLNVNVSGHPFYIVSAFNGVSFSSADVVATVQNNGATSGTITFDTKDVSPGTYYYLCANHPAAMNGQIIVGETENSYYIDNVTLLKNRRYHFDLSAPSNVGYNFVFKSSAAATSKLTADYITYDYTNNRVIIQPNDNTPSTLYYSAEISGSIPSPDYIGGFPEDKGIFSISGQESFSGSGVSIAVNTVNRNETVNIEVNQGNIIADNSVTTSNVSASTGTFTTELTADRFNFENSTLTIIGNYDLNIATSALNDIILDTRKLSVGDFDVLSTGEVETTKPITVTDANLILAGSGSSLRVNQRLFITDNTISTASTVNLVLSPASNSLVKITGSKGITIPAGTNLERPNAIQRENGTIRFNTDTNQYEGYNVATAAWSSLGGVRDLDGNTYILPEAFAGANDNTLYFYNDSVNSLRLRRSALDFWEMKTISSSNITAPTSTVWTENTPVSLGEYLRYRNNIYVVSVAGITDGPVNPPRHTTGAATNGTAQLTWNALAVDELVFDGINVLKVGPNADVPLQVSNELQLLGSEIKTLSSDLSITPFTGKKAIINTTTSLVIPSGTSLQRGIPARGSIRYNSTILQFEGYDGANWSSLGGVRDVDGNTYIIPELSAGSNENILYFYNDGNNSLRLTPFELVFDNVDTIRSVGGSLDINATTININSANVILQSSATTTKLTTTADAIEFAISSGIYADTISKFTDTGALLWNRTWGTGTPTFVELFKNDLSEFKLRDLNIITKDIQLVKGTTDFLPISLYAPSSSYGAKVVISADNVTSNHRELIEFTVTHKGTDIFHTEFGNVTTGLNIFSSDFSIDSNNGDVVITPTLTSSVAASDVVNITVVITLLRK